MKKILLSAAAFAVVAVSAVAVAPTTSEAIPAFARQTGAACLSCHFQTFPALTAFGRSFKQGAFTDVGEQALVEDEGLSIPAVLNATVVVRGNYMNTKTSPAIGASTTTGVWNIPSETPLLIAGRIGEHTGAFLEWIGGVGGANGSNTANFQVMNSFDFGSVKGGVNIFNASFGWTQGIEVSNVIGQHSSSVGNVGRVSAEMQMGFRAGNEQGLAFWVGNDMFTAQIVGIAPDAPGANVKFKLVPGVRVFATQDFGGWDVGFGFGAISGKKTYGNNAASYAIDNQFIDLQAQGEVGDTQIGFYADYAQSKYKVPNINVPAAARIVWGSWAAGAANGDKNQGFSLRATVKPLHNLMFGLGYGQVKFKPTVGASVTQKRTQVSATYEIYQNFEVNLAYWVTKNNAWVNGDKVTTTMLEFEALM